MSNTGLTSDNYVAILQTSHQFIKKKKTIMSNERKNNKIHENRASEAQHTLYI